MQPVFTTNDSEFSRLEGLYIKERNPPAQISGVSLNTVGVCGECVRGPVGEVIEITSEARFKEVFGGRDYVTGGTLIGKVWQSLLNKQFGKVAVVRARAAAAATASFTAEDNVAGVTGAAIIRIDATSPGLWGNSISFKVTDASDGDAAHFNLLVKYLGDQVTYKNLDCSTDVDNLEATIGTDDANWVVVTKLADGRPANTWGSMYGGDADGFVNLGETVSGFTSVAGTDGTIADSDFTATDGPIDLLAAHAGVSVVFIAERMSSTLKAKVAVKAAAVSDRMFIIGADSGSTTVSAAAAEAASYRSDRIIYAFNHPYTLDPETAALVQVRPDSFMASILSQTDVDIHPGEEDTKKYTAGISKLTYASLGREDYITLRNAGICALEKDDGFDFVSGRTTSLTPGKEEITRRRMADYLQLSIAKTLKYSAKKKNTETRRKSNGGIIQAFVKDLQKNERIVELYSVDTEKLNTVAQRALGVEKILMRVKLLGHMLHLVLETEIGTGVSVTEVA